MDELWTDEPKEDVDEFYQHFADIAAMKTRLNTSSDTYAELQNDWEDRLSEMRPAPSPKKASVKYMKGRFANVPKPSSFRDRLMEATSFESDDTETKVNQEAESEREKF